LETQKTANSLGNTEQKEQRSKADTLKATEANRRRGPETREKVRSKELT
jgi:hypothetical protein